MPKKSPVSPKPRLVDDFIKPAPLEISANKQAFSFFHRLKKAVHTKKKGERASWYTQLSQVQRRTLNVIVIVIIAAIIVGGWLYRNTNNTSGPIPKKFASGLSYPLYYPTNLPTGYRVDRSSFARRGNVLIFSVIGPNGENIAVSEEPRPANLDLGQTAPASGISLPDERAFTTSAGSAYISLWGAKLVSSLVTNSTWVLLNVTGFQMNAAQEVTQAFVEVN